MRKLLEKYRSLILYVLFGGLTTLVNLVCYHLCYNVLSLPNLAATAIAWFFSVVFAFVTNKLWVFDSKSLEAKVLLYELATFFSCRIATGLVDLAIMYVAVDVMAWNELVWKLASNVIVVILNFVASKLIIFKKK